MKTSILVSEHRIQGQALTEVLLTIILSLVIILTGARTLYSEWQTWKCSRELFEATYRARNNASRLTNFNAGTQMSFEKNEYVVRGKSSCGGRQHIIELPKVDYAFLK